MKIAYFGNIINHGIPLAAWGTGFLMSLSNQPRVDSITIFCPERDSVEQPVSYPPNFIIRPIIQYDNPLSILKVLRYIHSGDFDLVFFNLNATSLGAGSLINLLALSAPWIVSRVLKLKTFLLYHSSVLTTNSKKLGYNSLYDLFRMTIVKLIESILFVSVDTFVLLRIYKAKIDFKLRKNKVHLLSLSFLEPLPTLYFNFCDHMPDSLRREKSCSSPTILLHGFWGPQKNLELALEILASLKNDGLRFRVVLSGAINPHFSGYLSHYQALVDQYHDVIDELKGFVAERDILKLFLDADLLLLPYKVAGGHSGVLEIGFFFETNIIGITHQEYEEKAELMKKYLVLVEENNFREAVKHYVIGWTYSTVKTIVVGAKLASLSKSISELLNSIDSIHDIL